MDISKQFEFDYGHRVWSQKLNKELSCGVKPVCRHLHGHRGHIEVVLTGKVLENGMVTDFHHLNWFKQWIDEVIDHKFILDIKDPLINTLIPNWNTFGLMDLPYHKKVDTTNIKDEAHLELLESYTIVDFIPTSENLCIWFHKIVQNKMNEIGVTVKAIRFKETPKSTSYYEVKG